MTSVTPATSLGRYRPSLLNVRNATSAALPPPSALAVVPAVATSLLLEPQAPTTTPSAVTAANAADERMRRFRLSGVMIDIRSLSGW